MNHLLQYQPANVPAKWFESMSLPPEMIDELLSGYLDDTLSGDERRRVEQMLRDQPKMADELSELKNLRQSLRVLADTESQRHFLPTDFAERVIDSAVAQAKDEGLDANHPVLRAEQNDAVVAPAQVSSGISMFYRVAGSVAALAASIALIVYTMSDDSPSPNGLLDSDSLVSNDAVPEIDPETPFVPPEIVPDFNLDGNGPVNAEPMIASADSPSGDSVPGNIESTNLAEVDVNKTPPVVDPIDVQEIPGTFGFVPIFEVRLTQSGHEASAFQKALEGAGITLGDSRKLTPEIVAFAKSEADNDEDEAPEVILLECSIKKLAVLHNRLFADGEGVQSVRMGMSADAPIRGMIDAVRLDAKEVQHEAVGWPLVGPTEEMTSALGRELGKVQFFGDVGRGDLVGNLKMMAPAKEGQDTKMPLLILVR